MIDNSSDIPQKKCSKCPNSYPATSEFFPISSKGKLEARCTVCKKAYLKQYYETHKGQASEKGKERYETHREQILEQVKQYRETHKEQISERNKIYREIHKDEISKQSKQFRDIHKEQLRQRRKHFYTTHREQIRKRQKVYRETNREQLNGQKRRHYYAHRDEDNARRRTYRQVHLEQERVRAKLHRDTHKDEIRERRRFYRDVHREQIAVRKKLWQQSESYKTYQKQYYREHSKTERWKMLARVRRYKRIAQEKAVSGTYTAAQIQEQLKRQHYRCYYAKCGFAKFPRIRENGEWKYNYHVEHTFPLSRVAGGNIPANDMSYLVLSCHNCNLSKGKKFPWEWPEGGRLL